MPVHHADCGMRTFRDEGFEEQIETATGIRPSRSPETSPTPPSPYEVLLDR